MCVTRRSEEAGSNVKTERGEGVEDCKKKKERANGSKNGHGSGVVESVKKVLLFHIRKTHPVMRC